MSRKSLCACLLHAMTVKQNSKVGGDMLGHLPNSHFLQAGFCSQSPHLVTNITLNTRFTIFSQRPPQLASVPNSRIVFVLLGPGSPRSCLTTTLSLHWLLLLKLSNYFQIVMFLGFHTWSSHLLHPLLGDSVF